MSERARTRLEPSRRRKHLDTLQRRADLLERRLSEYGRRGNPEPQQRELAAIRWAIKVIDLAGERGMIDQLADEGERV